jgi:hypothetical protein
MTMSRHASVLLPAEFTEVLPIANAAERFAEALDVAERVTAAGVPLDRNPDHAAIFVDPPRRLADALKRVGYVTGWDTRCYPSPVDGCDYINVPAGLPPGHPARGRGWFDYVAVVHPVDDAAYEKMMSQGYGNPFIHHLTWRISAPPRDGAGAFDYARRVVPFMRQTRQRIGEALGAEPGALVIALPAEAVEHPAFRAEFPGWVEGLEADQFQLETMQGGGFLIQFFCLKGGRIEVALRVDTTQTFNPKSVHRISSREISTNQG